MCDFTHLRLAEEVTRPVSRSYLLTLLTCQVAEEVISMDNGCACCTVRGDLVRPLPNPNP